MKKTLPTIVVIGLLAIRLSAAEAMPGDLVLSSPNFAIGPGTLALGGFFYATASGRTSIPVDLGSVVGNAVKEVTMPDGREIKVSVKRQSGDFLIRLTASSRLGGATNAAVVKWGLTIGADVNEYFTGLMERVVDGPQTASWSSNLTAAMNLRGQKVDMICKPTTSIYAPFYLSSRGYGIFVHGTWPGFFDFCSSDPNHVKVEFEGPSFEMKIYVRPTPVEIVKAHALDAGPPFLPPKWMYWPWRWRDENTQRTNYYDGTRVTGPFNSEFMEDILLMKAYGISNGIYWVDRPWGPGTNGYDDFKIDAKRLPNFVESVKWLDEQHVHTVLWIGPFLNGEMAKEGLARHYTIAGQKPTKNNYPLVDFTNPDAKKFWQDGVAKLLKMGVAGFKLDRSEEDIPETGPSKVFDGRSVRENRNAYPPMYVKAAYDVAKRYRGNDFFCMPRAAYTGSAHYSVFWGGDIAGIQQGLRASLIAVQRAAVMGYPNWGSDTGGYTEQSMDTEVVERWLGFSCFTPIMEVGPTHNVAFWDFHKPARYDADLMAAWRFYSRLHARLAEYSYAAAREATKTGLPIIRPLFLTDPRAPAAWSNWWTYSFGKDIVVSPVWKKGQRTQQVYLPAGAKWADAWEPGHVYDGGSTIEVAAPVYQMPIFVRVGGSASLGDLNGEWRDAVAAAATRPDLKSLDAGVKAWFEKRYPRERAAGK